ncbi:hypothetical protein [Oceanicola sp. 502str15]|uniref:hypothetical protein n=1 Tax=Oceanicola sp. 502str15 TaxID=2696061 RepID=UPI00209449DA|nr:hypothetical protein [Oceanicola sp. 502str15]MCO6384604.1 antitoxin [Oceanicola sp. 502str15]
MPRLSIDITVEEHRKLKAIAALRGQSIKDFVMSRTLGDEGGDGMSEEEALDALRAVLMPRIEEARRGEFSDLTMDEIAAKAKAGMAG